MAGHAYPDGRSGRGVTHGVGHQVLDDALYLGGVHLGRERLGLDLHEVVLQVALADHALNQLGQIGGLAVGGEDSARQAIQVQQVREHLVELPRVAGQAAGEVLSLLGRQVQLVVLKGQRAREDAGERRPEVVRHGL